MKPANCFSVEYILGTRDNKPKEEKIVSKGKISSKDEEIHTKVDVQAEEKQENTNEVEDTPMTTSDKGNFLFSLLHCFSFRYQYMYICLLCIRTEAGNFQIL